MHRPNPVEVTSNESLARQARQGCKRSFAELVARLQVPIWRYLRRRTASAEDAEDLTQEVFLRAYQNLHRYQPKWPFKSWLFTIAHRQSINHYRRRVRMQQLRVVQTDFSTDPALVVEVRENRQRLWDLAAAMLTDSQWTSLWLFYVEEMSLDEIAGVLECSSAAIKALLYRARRKLANEWNKEEGRPQINSMRASMVTGPASQFKTGTDDD